MASHSSGRDTQPIACVMQSGRMARGWIGDLECVPYFAQSPCEQGSREALTGDGRGSRRWRAPAVRPCANPWTRSIGATGLLGPLV